jgi:hypothetical protein
MSVAVGTIIALITGVLLVMFLRSRQMECWQASRYRGVQQMAAATETYLFPSSAFASTANLFDKSSAALAKLPNRLTFPKNDRIDIDIFKRLF